MSELHPLDRVYYSSNPANMIGAAETADIEALLIPEVQDALEAAHDARTGQFKYHDPSTAQRILENVEITGLYLSDTAAPKLQKRLGSISTYLTEKSALDGHKQSIREQTEAAEQQMAKMPFGERIAAGVYDCLRRDQRPNQLLKDLSEKYAKDPFVMIGLIDAMVKHGETLEQTIVKDLDSENSRNARLCLQKSQELIVQELAQQPFPFFTAAPSEIIRLFNYSALAAQNSDGISTLHGIGVHIEPKDNGEQDVLRSIKPDNMATALIAVQMINSFESVRTPAEATQLINHYFQIALDNSNELGAQNFLDMLVLFYTNNSVADVRASIEEFGIKTKPNSFVPKTYLRFIALIMRDRIHYQFKQNDQFRTSKAINMAVKGSDGLDADVVMQIIEATDKIYGLSNTIDIAEKERTAMERAQKQIDSEGNFIIPLNWSHWHHRAQEIRYDKHRSAELKDMLLSPREAFAKTTFAKQQPGTDPLERMREDYSKPYAVERLSHRGYFNTVAEMLEWDLDTEQYAAIADEIEKIKTDTYVHGDFFVSPRGDKFIVDNGLLSKAGIKSVTYRKQPGNRRFTQVTLEAFSSQLSCVITPELDLLTDDGAPLLLRNNLAEPVQYLIYGYLHALKCQPETVTETKDKATETEAPNPMIVRRAHMRRLPADYQPRQRQIDLALEREDFDVVEDNKWRVRKHLPVRTYVEETVIYPGELDPNTLRAKSVTKRLSELAK